MPRLASLVSTASALALLGSVLLGCATYRQDLERAQKHYEENQYEKALALFRVLEPDIDSLSDAEQAKYAYLRGMTDYRLAGLSLAANVPGGVADPKRGYRDNARHWLAVAAATEKNTPGGLTADEKKRLEDALSDLNKDVYGGVESVEDKAEGTKKPEDAAEKKEDPSAAPAAPAPTPAPK
ncbi:hypothetical protein [Polyangium sp. 15x6]|uniref:hypothetical protein n=1 Tax=Polyangium sp. 15x6 TaxID=3042687 RepID=UPI00249A2E31|nr:hypothetical protein [Polyangium sp. 15x6]MDI3282893.1 hypothetical protein [Polyangium sp. 15x6]